MKLIRSRIKEHIPDGAIDKIFKICYKRSVTDNNKKIPMITDVLDSYEIDYHMLGPGTNRLAVLIDGYVFKFAMDDWGVRDNRNEAANSYELQPFVIKTYETNGLISVCEYVTLVTREDFMASRDAILSILGILADSYLLGDVGYTEKNFTNWGYRDDGQIVILDFAYIYQIQPDIIRCSEDNNILDYTPNFTSLICPRCHRKYSFIDLRRRIHKEYEMQKNDEEMQSFYVLTEPKMWFDDEESDESEIVKVTKNDILGKNQSKQVGNIEIKEDDKMYLSDEELEINRENALMRLADKYRNGGFAPDVSRSEVYHDENAHTWELPKHEEVEEDSHVIENDEIVDDSTHTEEYETVDEYAEDDLEEVEYEDTEELPTEEVEFVHNEQVTVIGTVEEFEEDESVSTHQETEVVTYDESSDADDSAEFVRSMLQGNRIIEQPMVDEVEEFEEDESDKYEKLAEEAGYSSEDDIPVNRARNWTL